MPDRELNLGDRVLVIGSPGTGKSTIAREVARLTDLPIVHLDRIYHDPDEQFLHDKPRWRAYVVDHLLQAKLWVMDGHYPATLPQRVAAADTVIHLDYPTRVALAGVIGRRWKPTDERHDMPEGWQERVSWSLVWSVLRFRQSEAPKVRRLLSTMEPPQRVITLRSREEADRFLSGMAGSSPGP